MPLYAPVFVGSETGSGTGFGLTRRNVPSAPAWMNLRSGTGSFRPPKFNPSLNSVDRMPFGPPPANAHMKTPCILLLAAALLSTSASFSGEPESPAIWREVTGVINDHSSGSPVPKFTRPHMPGFRTSEDGRVAIICEGGGALQMPSFTLMKPEKMTKPFLTNAPGAHTMSWTQFKWLDGYATASASREEFATGGKRPSHACLWEISPPIVVNG